jgi:hypothetical protein
MVELSIRQSTPAITVAITIFILLIVFYILGHRLRNRNMLHHSNGWIQQSNYGENGYWLSYPAPGKILLLVSKLRFL